MSKLNFFFILLSLSFLSPCIKAQTSKDIQGTWRIITTTITSPDGTVVFKMDSSTHNLTKTITRSRMMFTVYDKKTDSLLGSGQGMAFTKGNQYTEKFEQSTNKDLLEHPAVFTYKVQGNILAYSGGTKDFHIAEVLRRIE